MICRLVPSSRTRHWAAVVELYERFAEQVRACGPVAVVPTRSGISFQIRTIFVAVNLHPHGLAGRLVLARRLADQAFTRIEPIALDRHGHDFWLDPGQELHAGLTGWLREAYAVGQQSQPTEERTWAS